jgi:hypothetical protein
VVKVAVTYHEDSFDDKADKAVTALLSSIKFP